MSAGTPRSMATYRDAQAAVRKAEKEAARALRDSVPVGSTVVYRHGETERFAEVCGVSDDRVRVTGAAGTRYWLCASRIVKVLPP